MRQRLAGRGETDYQVRRDNDTWPDHRARALVTASLLAWQRPRSVLDPACGDASIVRQARLLHPIGYLELGDISENNVSFCTGLMIADAVWKSDVDDILRRARTFDAIVLTEILEHLQDPDATLVLARQKGKVLIASSPVMRSGQQDPNPEHLWQFDREGYEEMLRTAGWQPFQYTFLHFENMYDFGIWVCQ